jgi:hypothetical protein
VAQSLSMDQLQKLAAYGARARVEELRAEIAAITEAFPDLAGSAAAVPRPRRGRPPASAGPSNGRRRRRRRGKLSAAGRAAISAAQKKRWAAIRKKRGAGES